MADATLIHKSQLPNEPKYNVPDEELGLTAKPCAMTKKAEEGKNEPIQKIGRSYFTDMNGTELQDTSKEEEVYFVIESENMSGEEVVISVPSQKGEFSYNDEIITEEKVLKVNITGDQEKIKLQVVPKKGHYTPAVLNNYYEYDTAAKETEHEHFSDLDKMAIDAWDTLPEGKNKNMTTVAIGIGSDGKIYVSTSGKYVQKSIQKWAKENNIVIISSKTPNVHAEESLHNFSGTIIVEVGSSKPICLDCENGMKKNNIDFNDENTKGARSRKRILEGDYAGMW